MRRQLLISTFLSAGLAVLPSVSWAKTAPEPSATPFSLPSAKGDTVALQSYAGKWVVLEWVNYDCPFVKKHYHSGNMPALQKEMRDKGVVWLSINSSAEGKQGSFRGEELFARMKDEKAGPDQYLIDANGEVGRAYGAKTTPTMVVIDPKGRIVYQGAIDDHPSTDVEDIPKSKNYVRLALESALAGKPVATKQTKSYGCSVKYSD